jgi:cytochrome c5
MSASRASTVVSIFFVAMSVVATVPACRAQGAASLFRDRCSQCHHLPDPAMHSSADWPPLVEKMRNFMYIAHKKELTEQQMQEIIGYLQAHAEEQK